MPTIHLPTFDGNYEKWLEFHDTFLSLIHNNEDISRIQKFHYLKSSLRGDAARLISSIDISASGYETAWQAVCKRYDNKKLLIYNHINAIFSVPKINKETALDIRNLNESISKHLRILDTLLDPERKWDALLIYVISSKLDPTTIRDWEKHQTESDLTNFRNITIIFKK